ncbi:hypothetical protein BV20DRAFT_234441 [Pilatotrama ljubarskyi]|nr:hypothetical protein BV20DRAFT_234441 [Pilatotrama ljubarskyi]
MTAGNVGQASPRTVWWWHLCSALNKSPGLLDASCEGGRESVMTVGEVFSTVIPLSIWSGGMGMTFRLTERSAQIISCISSSLHMSTAQILTSQFCHAQDPGQTNPVEQAGSLFLHVVLPPAPAFIGVRISQDDQIGEHHNIERRVFGLSLRRSGHLSRNMGRSRMTLRSRMPWRADPRELVRVRCRNRAARCRGSRVVGLSGEHGGSRGAERSSARATRRPVSDGRGQPRGRSFSLMTSVRHTLVGEGRVRAVCCVRSS